MGEIASEQHLRQALANIVEDERLTGDEKAGASERAQTQHALLQVPGTDPLLWDDNLTLALGGLSAGPSPLMPSDPQERLGNVWALASFERSVAQQFGCNYLEASRLVALCLKPPGSVLSREERLDLAEFRHTIRLRTSEVWLFQGEQGGVNPYGAIELADVPCTLGLPFKKGEKFVAFRVPVSDALAAHRPCVYDVCWLYQELWRPGGRTKPLCHETPKEQGAREWIAIPPMLSEVEPTVVQAEVGDCLEAGAHGYDA